jgi:hypothetical protein
MRYGTVRINRYNCTHAVLACINKLSYSYPLLQPATSSTKQAPSRTSSAGDTTSSSTYCTHRMHHTNTHSTRHLLLALSQQVPRCGLVLLCWVAHTEAVLRAGEAGLAGAAQEERLALPAQRVVYKAQYSTTVNTIWRTYVCSRVIAASRRHDAQTNVTAKTALKERH